MDTSINLNIKNNYRETMLNEGVCLFKNRIDEKTISHLRKEIQKIRDIVGIKINKMPRPLKTYSDIAERQLGRLDYRCGFSAEIFAETVKPIKKIIEEISPLIDFKYYWGAIPALGGSGPTDLHRDVYPLLNNTTGNDLNDLDIRLPPYYLTVFLPLVQITKQNGPTEFIKGSHQRPIVNFGQEEIYAPLLSPGDMIIFDGRTLHRGSPNQTKDERIIAYITFVANWYHDQTFIINDYLFPELSTKGR